VFSTTIIEYLPTLYEPIHLHIDIPGRTASVSVPGVVEGQAETIRNPVTKAPHQVRMTMPAGFEFSESEVVNGRAKAPGPITLDFQDTHAHLARIHWSNRGVVR